MSQQQIDDIASMILHYQADDGSSDGDRPVATAGAAAAAAASVALPAVATSTAAAVLASASAPAGVIAGSAEADVTSSGIRYAPVDIWRQRSQLSGGDQPPRRGLPSVTGGRPLPPTWALSNSGSMAGRQRSGEGRGGEGKATDTTVLLYASHDHSLGMAAPQRAVRADVMGGTASKRLPCSPVPLTTGPPSWTLHAPADSRASGGRRDPPQKARFSPWAGGNEAVTDIVGVGPMGGTARISFLSYARDVLY